MAQDGAKLLGSLILLDLVGGVALLLRGLHRVHSGIVRAFESDLRRFLGVALRNHFLAFLAGVLVTPCFQHGSVDHHNPRGGALLHRGVVAGESGMKISSPVIRCVASVVLSLVTLALISTLDHLPYSETRTAVRDVLSMPGGILAWVVTSGGVHGSYPMLWVFAAITGNVLFYSLLWWLVLRSGSSLARRRKGSSSKPASVK